MSIWIHRVDDCHKRLPFCRLNRIYDLCLSILIFSCVCVCVCAGFVAFAKSCRITLNGVHSGVLDLKILSC